jgi:hypothetical protein
MELNAKLGTTSTLVLASMARREHRRTRAGQVRLPIKGTTTGSTACADQRIHVSHLVKIGVHHVY